MAISFWGNPLNVNKNMECSDAESDEEINVTEMEASSVGVVLQPYQFEPVARVVNHEPDMEADPAPPEPEDARLDNTNWCSCGQCEVMPTVTECICCQEVDKVEVKVQELEVDPRPDCICHHPGFEPVCLNHWVLQTAYFAYRQQYGNVIGQQNRRYRYTAYRQFVRWCWGYLGRKVRVPIPSCVVNRIRQEFPEDGQIYVGFQLPPL